jgi:hypothetical protein
VEKWLFEPGYAEAIMKCKDDAGLGSLEQRVDGLCSDCGTIGGLSYGGDKVKEQLFGLEFHQRLKLVCCRRSKTW